MLTKGVVEDVKLGTMSDTASTAGSETVNRELPQIVIIKKGEDLAPRVRRWKRFSRHDAPSYT